jgi:PAS domain S-box-containing protein
LPDKFRFMNSLFSQSLEVSSPVNEKPTYEDLEQTIKALEEAALEARRLQEALKESREMFRILADSTPTAVMLYQDNRWIYTNRAAQTVTGYSAEEFLKMNFWDIAHPDCRALIRERGWKRQEGKETTHRYEFKIIAKDGTEKWVDLAGASTLIGGRPAGIVSVSDITDRKRAEQAIRESEEKFAESFLKSPIPMAITNMKDGRYIDVNTALAKVMGLQREELIGKTSTDIGYITVDERALFLDEYHRKGSVENLELQIRVKGGELRQGLFNASKITIGGEDFFLTMVTDIDDLKRAEQALRKSEEKYRLLAETVTDVIFTMDKNLRFTYISPSVTRLLGYSAEEVMAQSPADALTPASREIAMGAFAEEMRNEANGSDNKDRIRILALEEICKDGSTIWTETIFNALRDEDEKFIGILGITRDITERKKAAEERERLISERQKALSEIKILSGMLPICSSCKKIRNDEGYWEQLENYIRDHSGAEFSHGLCPDCTKKFYETLHQKK